MAGLSSAYISNKLAAEGTTAPTQTLILAFLNNAAAIAGIEPNEGPVVDDPMEGYGDQECLLPVILNPSIHPLLKRRSI